MFLNWLKIIIVIKVSCELYVCYDNYYKLNGGGVILYVFVCCFVVLIIVKLINRVGVWN